MQANTLELFGMLVETLIDKAAVAPVSLTYPECRLVRDNFRFYE